MKHSEKWITIGAVQWPWFVFELGTGTPEGYRMIWRGRVGVFQPVQFRKAEHLCWAIERRLQLVGLQWVAMATGREHGLYGTKELKVLVRRETGFNAETQRTQRYEIRETGTIGADDGGRGAGGEFAIAGQ